MRQPSFVLALAASFAAPVCAESLPEFTGETLIVTPTRTGQTLDRTLAPIEVIRREEIERLQAGSLIELLSGRTGITLANSGGAGKQTSLFLRGGNSNHVLVLIDGIKIGSATSGQAAIQDIPVERIERIEIVRGPRSSLYGSEAIGGVIQIFTRKGGGDTRASMSASYGSHDTVRLDTRLAGGGDRAWFDVGLGYTDTNGINACRGAAAGCFADEPDRDGYENRNVALRGGYRFGSATIDVNFLRAEGENEFDGGIFSGNEGETVQQVAGATLRLSLSPRWNLNASAGRSLDKSDNFFAGTFVSTFDTRRDSFSLQQDFAVTEGHRVTLGADRQNDRLDTTVAFARTRRHVTGFYAQYQGEFSGHGLQLALRNDDNSQFGNHVTGNAAWGYALPGGFTLGLGYGTAFSAPTFNQLYFPGGESPGLEPEKSRSIEASLARQLPGGRWQLTAFRNRINQLITGFPAVNIGEARIVGLELAADARFDDWTLAAGLTLQEPETRSGTNRGNTLPRRASESLRVDLDRRLSSAWRLGATLRAEGKRYDDAANTVRLHGYGLVDLRADYQPAPGWRIAARIENLFDREYETVHFFNQPGRTAFVTLGYQPR